MEKNLLPMVFNHEEFGQLRVLKINEVPWAVATDVAKILGIEKIRNTLANFPDNEKKMFDILTTAHTVGGGGGVLKPTWCVNEPGLYRLIFQSRKPEAENFKTWVFHEVLPALRKTGEYKMNEEKTKSATRFEIYEGTGEGEFCNIPRLEVNGEPVLSSSQLANFFGCSTANLRNTFKRNKGDFIEGEHYFKLEGEAMKDFKRSVTDCYSVTNGYEPFINIYSPSLILWTTLGAARFAKSLRTKKAWEVYEKLVMNYFSVKKNLETNSVKEKNSDEKISKTELTAEKKIKFLLQAAKITKDAATRENLISMATALINGNK